MQNVSREELRDSKRFDEAVQKGIVNRSEWDQLRFFALAEHALRVGTQNPAGLFSTNVRAGRWEYTSGDDEQNASRRLGEIRANEE